MFNLTVQNGPIEFEWDADSGALRGRDAAQVRAMSVEAAAQGTMTGDPYPTVQTYTTRRTTPRTWPWCWANSAC